MAMAIATIDLDPSYITHQRRFALIPPDCRSTLSAEDERSVRIRTGDVIPATSFCQSQVSVQHEKNDAEQHLAIDTSANENDCRGTKRKSSTTAEGYHAAVILGQEEHASASLETGDDQREQEKVDLECKGQ
jgi:hypothetical protein